MKLLLSSAITLFVSMGAMGASAAPVYLNESNISVSVGLGTSAGTFNNTFDAGSTINKVIDAPTATSEEFHNQTTHIWFTASADGGGLELLFDFGIGYDITTLHFWNYTAEGFDVDDIEFTFFNPANIQVGMQSLAPALGSSPGILAQDIALPAPLNVQFVTVFLSGSNRQVDFQNIGFTAGISAVPIPAAAYLFISALGGLIIAKRKQLKA